MNDFEALVNGARSLGVRLTPEHLGRFRTYLAGLTDWNSRMNLTSASALADAERIHLLDSLTLVPLIRRDQPAAERVVDVGSGAGFPGLAIKVVMPELHVVLIEATRKKADFLRWMAGELGCEGVEVVAERAEDAAHDEALRGTFDVALARSLGPLPVVMELTLPFCRAGGVLLAHRGRDEPEAADCNERVAAKLGARFRGIEPVGVDSEDRRTSIAVVDKIGGTSGGYPRRSGVPAKRPLD
jgi:16S rRNA (guanine527-N7)-methyltransferase